MPRRYTFAEVNQFYMEHGCTLLETEYKNSETPMRYICKCGREHVKDFEHFKRTPHCPECSWDVLSKKFANDFDNVRKVYSDNGAKLLSDVGEYKNENSVMRFVCGCGNVDEKPFYQFRNASHCKMCNTFATYTIEDVRKKVSEYGATLISAEYKNVNEPLEFVCGCGNIGHRSFKWILKSERCLCDYCVYSPMRYDFDYVREYVESIGWRLLSDSYQNGTTKLDCVCDRGHFIQVPFRSLLSGHRCGKCADDDRRLAYGFVRDYFALDGYALDDVEYRDNDQLLHVHCPNNHAWTVAFGQYRNGTRCIYCFHDELRHEYDYVKSYVESRSYTLHSKSYTNGHEKIEVECPHHHRYFVQFDSFKAGCRCRACYFEKNRGENHPSWNPNLTEEERIRGRHYPEYYEWVATVKSRDNYTCQCCGSKKRIEAHHLDNYADFPDKRLDLENGLALCFACHSAQSPTGFHKICGLHHTTRHDYEEYKQWRRQQLGIVDIESEVS